MQLLLETAALTVAGLLVGIEFCVAVFVNPILDRLPGDNGLLGRSDGARVLGRIMPFWYSAAIVLSVVLATVGPGRTWAHVAGAASFVTSIIMSIAFLVPINDRVKGWTAAVAPPDWRSQLQRWDSFHFLRLAVIAAGFVLISIGSVRG